MQDCIFCKILKKQAPAYIVYEDKDTIAFLDRRPQTAGHLQLAPKVHVRWIYDIENIGSFFVTAKMLIRGIIPLLGAEHVRLATYGDEVAHAHLWIVPHYGYQSKPLPEKDDLRAVWKLLHNKLGGGAV